MRKLLSATILMSIVSCGAKDEGNKTEPAKNQETQMSEAQVQSITKTIDKTVIVAVPVDASGKEVMSKAEVRLVDGDASSITKENILAKTAAGQAQTVSSDLDSTTSKESCGRWRFRRCLLCSGFQNVFPGNIGFGNNFNSGFIGGSQIGVNNGTANSGIINNGNINSGNTTFFGAGGIVPQFAQSGYNWQFQPFNAFPAFNTFPGFNNGGGNSIQGMNYYQFNPQFGQAYGGGMNGIIAPNAISGM